PLGSGDGPERSVAAVEAPDLLRRFGAVSDGRSEQGRDHPVAVVLTLCAAAVLGGMRSFTAIAGWVGDVPAEVLTLWGSVTRCRALTWASRVVPNRGRLSDVAVVDLVPAGVFAARSDRGASAARPEQRC